MPVVANRFAPVAMFSLLLALATAGGCGGVAATPEQKRLGERALLQPFLQSRTVGCAELVIEMTPNFHLHVSNPGHNERLQRFDMDQQEALVEKTWTNLAGTQSGWFTVTISKASDPTDVSGKKGPHTKFTVMNRLVIRTKERGNLTLSARATGPVVVVQDAGAPARDVREFAIVDGVLER